MNNIQTVKHLEQVAVHRREFNKHWTTRLEPYLVKQGYIGHALTRMQIASWRDWLGDAKLDSQIKAAGLI